MTSPLDDNLAALARLDASSVAWLREPTGGDGAIALEGEGADVRLIASDGRSLRLHSARNALAEADTQVAQALGDSRASVVAVVGAGAGFVLDALEARASLRVLVVEPTRASALAWLRRRSWRALFESGRLRLLVGPAYPGIANVSQFLGDAWTHLPVVVNPVLLREAPAEMARAREVLDRAAREALQNANARSRFEDLAFRNTLSNLPQLLREADAATLGGAFRGRPAIVLGAGPSLDANVAALRGLDSSCLVIAADTAVVPSIKGGVTPHLAVALDPSLENARHLTRTLVPDSLHLVCEASVDPSVPAAFEGRTFFFRVGRHAPWPWLESAGVTLGMLAAWGSVVTSALDLAVGAGCSPIIFAGLDLAFTGGQPYCRHTPLDDAWAWRVAAGERVEDIWAAHLNARPMVRERAIEGGDTPTAAHLVAFRDWIRDYAAARPQLRVINTTGAGILHGAGIEVAGLDDLASLLPITAAADLSEIMRRTWAAAATTSARARVLERVTRASPVELLEGHSVPPAAADRLDVARLWERIVTLRPRQGPSTARRPSATVSTAEATSGTTLWMPEAARALRAFDPGRRETPADVDQRRPQRAREQLGRAFEGIRELSRQDLEGTPDAVYRDPGSHAWADVPAVLQADWPRDVRPLVEAVTTAIHEAIRSWGPGRDDDELPRYFSTPSDPRVEGMVLGPSVGEPPLTPVQAALDALVCQWARVAAAVLDTDATASRFIRCLRASRPPLLPSPRAATGLRLWLASGDETTPTGGVPVVPFLHNRATMRASTGLLTLDPSSVPGSQIGRPPERAFHLFGLPETWMPEEALRTHHVPWAAMVAPEVLTDRGLGACRLTTRANDRQALVTLVDGSGSYTVDESGRFDRAEAWPRRVDGEIPCGRTGRVAWNWDGAHYLLFRRAPREPALVWELPVAPMHALDDGEESAILATASGLWRWRAATGPVAVAPGPLLASLHRRGTNVCASPRPTVLENGNRLPVDRAIDWSESASACEERRIGAGEACVARSVQGPWSADTLMDASAVRLTHASGATFWLACSGPRSAAWAGRSLVVTMLASGDVLLFRNLLDLVEPLLASTGVDARV